MASTPSKTFASFDRGECKTCWGRMEIGGRDRVAGVRGEQGDARNGVRV
ncbi:MAG: hypothetical protein ABEL76_05360 [Bradymonadaceae bacterium]